MKNATVAKYAEFNHRRYSNPWIAICDDQCKPVFRKKAGTYTGGYRGGDAGELVVYEPVDGAVYMYGQKDYRKPQNTDNKFVVFHHEKFWRHDKAECMRWLSTEEQRLAISESDMAEIPGEE